MVVSKVDVGFGLDFEIGYGVVEWMDWTLFLMRILHVVGIPKRDPVD